MKKILDFIFLVLFLVLTSCVSGLHNTESLYLDVVPYDGNEIDVKKYISIVDTFVLCVDDKVISYKVTDACMDDSTVFILDDQKNIMSFDLKSGVMKSVINKVGHGHGEYSQPISICVSKDVLYVLDYGGKMLKYDKKLKFMNSIRLDFSAMDFIKVKDGFFFYNLFPNENIKSVVSTDEYGTVKKSYSYTQNTKMPDIMLTSKLFTRTDAGIYVTNITYDTLYEFRDGEFVPVVQISDENSDNKDCKLYRCFPLKNSIITFYESKKHIIGNIYDKKTGKSMSGKFKSPINYPIFPSFERNGTLYGLYPQPTDVNKYILVKYRLNN